MTSDMSSLWRAPCRIRRGWMVASFSINADSSKRAPISRPKNLPEQNGRWPGLLTCSKPVCPECLPSATFAPVTSNALRRRSAKARSPFHSCTRFCRNSFLFRRNLAIPEAIDQVVVDHADRLHMRVDDCGTDEAESAALEVLAEGIGLG